MLHRKAKKQKQTNKKHAKPMRTENVWPFEQPTNKGCHRQQA